MLWERAQPVFVVPVVSTKTNHWVLTSTCYILYPIVQRNHWFASSYVPFQSVTNNLLHGQFAMQMYALHQVDVTSELLHLWWFAHAQSNNKTINVWLFNCVTLDLFALASGLIAKNRALSLRPHVLFLSTRLEARAYKSNVTCRAIHWLLPVHCP